MSAMYRVASVSADITARIGVVWHMGILYVQPRGVVIGGERTREQAWYYIGGWLSIAVVGAIW